MDSVLSIENLSKSYRAVQAVKNLNLEILRGQAFGILGPNGSGKTTTLSVITGILRQDAGSFRWFGQAPVPAQRKMIGSLIETPNFYPYLNLERNLKVICDIKEISYTEIDRVLSLSRLLERKRSRFSTLSLGMKQRLGIAAALLGDPEVLVLDEPTNGLDPEGIAEVREMVMDQVSAGKTLILASHILSEVEKICSHVAILRKGVLLASGSVKELLTEETVVEVACANNQLLKKKLENSDLVSEITEENKHLVVILKQGKDQADLNRFAFGEDLVLTHLINRKKSLEAQFLELVKQ
ncbi:MAG: ABC transporter ATP-binding protein [Bacteroidota bacterium]